MIEQAGRRPGADGAWLRETLPFVGIFLFVFAANIAGSLLSGRLAAPPGYDDVSYLNDALDRLTFASGSGLFSILASFWQQPPHAPLTTLTGIAGYGLLGPADVSAYIANGWALALYIAFMAYLSRPLGNLPARILLVAVLAYVPAAHVLVTEFRPDPAGGLIFAIAIWTVCRTDFRSASTPRLALAMALGVAAVVAKPTAFIVSIPGFGVAAAATIIAQALAERQDLGRLARRALLAALLYVLFLAPFAIVFARSTLVYVGSVLFTNAEVWRTEGDRWFHFAFHLSGDGPTIALGPFRFVALGLIAVDLALFALRPAYRRPEVLPFAATLLVLYVAMSLSGEKTVFQGCFFYFPVLVAAVSAFVRLSRAAVEDGWIAQRGLTAALAAILALSVATLPVLSSPELWIPGGDDAKRLLPLAANEIMRVYTGQIAGPDCVGYRPIVAVSHPHPLTAEALQMTMARRGVRVGVRRIGMMRMMSHVTKALDKVDFALAVQTTAPRPNDRLPIGKLLPEIYDYLAARPDTQKIAIGTYHGDTYWLFARPLCRSATRQWDQPPA